jgi:hypothetical protein
MLTAFLLLPGCIKYYELSTTEFNQGKEVEQKSLLTQNFVRTIRLYDQFSTIALFDSLWLSPDVRTSYSKRFCDKRGKDEATLKAIENRQLEETNHWIGFYVLADIRTRHNTSLNEKNAAWTFYLTINDKIKVEPLSIKEVELEPEYQEIFGHRFNNFKTAYLVKFPAYGLDGKPYITTPKPTLSLHVCGPQREGTAVWNKSTCSQTMARRDDDFYWI